MPGIENRGRVIQKRFLFLLHPWVIGHVRAVVMQLPAVSDRQMIRQYLAIDEEKAILPEITIARTIVDVFDQIAVGIGPLRKMGRQLDRVFNPFEIIAAMRPDRPNQNGAQE